MTDDLNVTMTLEESVAYAAMRSLHSHWLDTLHVQSKTTTDTIFAAMGRDVRFENWHAHVSDPDGIWLLVRHPAGQTWADVYELRLRTPGDLIPFVRVQGQRLGLLDAVLPDAEVEIEEDLLDGWLGQDGTS